MLRSMTGYGSKEATNDAGILTWEIRAVNHRYLEVGLRLPKDFRSLEPVVREKVGQKLKRCKVDVSLRFKQVAEKASSIIVNQLLADQIIEAAKESPRNFRILPGLTHLVCLTGRVWSV